MVTGRTKGLTFRGKGNVVLVAAQLDDADGNPTEEYVLLRADEFGRLRTIDAGAVATFLGLTDTPGSYAGQALLTVQVNAAEDALEFVAAAAGIPTKADLFDLGLAHWTVPGWAPGTTGDSASEADQVYYIPIYLERSTPYTRLGCHVAGAGAGGTVARLGIYAAVFDGDGQLIPDTLTLDAGTVSVATTGEKTIVIAETLAAGWHFLAFSTDGTPTLRAFSEGAALGAPITGYRTAIAQGGNQLFKVAVADGAAALVDPAPAPTTRDSAARIYPALRR